MGLHTYDHMHTYVTHLHGSARTHSVWIGTAQEPYAYVTTTTGHFAALHCGRVVTRCCELAGPYVSVCSRAV